MIDITAHHIYYQAERDAINSWLRTLAAIRALDVRGTKHQRPR